MDMYKNDHGITCVCDNCGRCFEADLPKSVLRKIKSPSDLREEMFPDEKYNIRYLIRYDLCWKCRKDPEGMRIEREIRERMAKENRQRRFMNWVDSL